MARSLNEVKELLDEEGILFSFNGPISHNMVEMIGSAVKARVEMEDQDNLTVMKVFSIFVEQVQNISHYSSEVITIGKGEGDQLEEMRVGVIIIGKKNGNFYVNCGNLVETKDKESLKSQITLLQGMDKDELKKYYKEKRRSKNENEESKGAGLGFIEMARKASDITFDFADVDDKNSFFSIKIII